MHEVAQNQPAFALGCFPPASPALVLEAGKQKAIPAEFAKHLKSSRKIGAGEGIRTLDPDLGKDHD
jgi:hypothetical protein